MAVRWFFIAGLTVILTLPGGVALAGDSMKLVILGTGTPNADPERSGPALAIIKNHKSYIVDAGAGIVRRAAAAAKKHHISSLSAENLTTAFLTHLHSDHTLGLPDLILSPWVLERKQPLDLFGPVGTEEMVSHLLEAYQEDIRLRLSGLQPANPDGYKVNATEIAKGKIVLKTDSITVTAFPVKHGSWQFAYGYIFSDGDKKIVISGDTRPTPALIKAARGAEILVHEVYSLEQFKKRPREWQIYHASFHTSTRQLAEIARQTSPGLLVLYHQLFWGASDADLVREIHAAGYKGKVISAHDLDIF